MSLNNVPSDLMVEITKHLSIQDLVSLSSVTKDFRNKILNKTLLEWYCKNNNIPDIVPSTDKIKFIDWLLGCEWEAKGDFIIKALAADSSNRSLITKGDDCYLKAKAKKNLPASFFCLLIAYDFLIHFCNANPQERKRMAPFFDVNQHFPVIISLLIGQIENLTNLRELYKNNVLFFLVEFYLLQIRDMMKSYNLSFTMKFFDNTRPLAHEKKVLELLDKVSAFIEELKKDKSEISPMMGTVLNDCLSKSGNFNKLYDTNYYSGNSVSEVISKLAHEVELLKEKTQSYSQLTPRPI